MSALVLPALAVLQRSMAAPPALFADLASYRPDPAVVRLDSTGYTITGRGAATYIADGLADEAMLAAHPRFTFKTANGRIFRLLPDKGSLAVEQGGAQGDGLANDQPAIQAAIDYAEKVDARELRFERLRYRIHATVRTSPLHDSLAADGHPLVVRKSLALRGCARDRSVLEFYGLDGTDPETSWQTVATSASNPAPAVWRGGGLLALGEWADPGPDARRIGRLELDRLVFKGQRSRTGNSTWPADPSTGDGWDISDKAFWLQDTRANTIICRDVDMIGWKGEIFFLAGWAEGVARLELTRCRFAPTNGSAFNPGVNCEILAEDCEFGDASQGQEETGKRLAVYRGCTWRDCDYTGIGSGPTAAIQYHFNYPTRDAAQPVPMTLLDNCRFIDAGNLAVSSWVRGNILTVDTGVLISGNQSHAVRDIDISIEAWLDRRQNFEALSFFGVDSLTQQVPGAPAGTYQQPPTQMRLRVRHFRTAQAAANGLEWFGVYYNGYIARDCRIEAEGDFLGGRTLRGQTGCPSMPFVRFSGGAATSGLGARGYWQIPTITASGGLAPSAPLMAVQAGSETNFALTLPAYPSGGAAYGYADGQVIRILKNGDVGALTFAKGAAASMAMTASRTLDLADDWIEFTYNRQRARWEESGFFSAV